MSKDVSKIVLAYSGGLDTSVIIQWLRETYGCPVVAFVADVGQGEDLEAVREKALKTGVAECFVEDLREEFVRDYVFPIIRAGAVYEGGYLLGTSIARPLIAKAQMDLARRVGADAVAHGATGKGNDQVRFELTYLAVDPKIRIIAPWREWDFKGREDLIAYAKTHGIPVPVTKERPYSTDRNLLHLSFEGGVLEDPWSEPPEDMYVLTVSPEKAPDRPEYVEIEFERGDPVSVNGEAYTPANLLARLNGLAGAHGIGRADLVENRFVGIKSRGIYEAPGMELLGRTYELLLQFVLDRRARQLFDQLSAYVSNQIYQGYWLDLATTSALAALEPIKQLATGTITVRLYKGEIYFET
ncbi:MAG: argininosuccinate synthase, partial [Nitrospinota bacterium]|nr:argininosuccinate synthase [Nitrospinota bacterium]